MKKAKVMLTGIAVIAVVAGVFAFKAKSQQQVWTFANNTCNLIQPVGLFTPDPALLTYENATTVAADAANGICTTTIYLTGE